MMTVSMMVYRKVPNKYVREVLISTNRLFDECWIPLGEKLRLETIPLYYGGIVAQQGNTGPIISDLRAMRKHLIHYPETPYANYMMGRINGLISALKRIEASSNLEGWFG